MENIKLFLKGMLVGLGKVIPGVSGAMIAISLNIYDQGINTITCFFSNPKQNFKFLLFVGGGAFCAIIILSGLIGNLLQYHYFVTMLFFLGLMVGGLPNLLKESKLNKKNYCFFIIPCLIIISSSFITNSNNQTDNMTYINFFYAGFIDAFAMVIPGISGTAILMYYGYYQNVLIVLSNLGNISFIIRNISVVGSLMLGLVLGIIITTKIINYCFLKYRSYTNATILGVSLATIIILISKTIINNFTNQNILVGVVLFLLGFFIVLKMDKY